LYAALTITKWITEVHVCVGVRVCTLTAQEQRRRPQSSPVLWKKLQWQRIADAAVYCYEASNVSHATPDIKKHP